MSLDRDSAYSRLSAPGKSGPLLFFYFSIAYLATAQFIKAAMPSTTIVVIPTDVIVYLLVIAQVVPALALFVIDRTIDSRGSPRLLATFRSVVVSATLLLIVRQLELYPPGRHVADAVREISPFLLGLALVSVYVLAIWASFRWYRGIAQTIYYFSLPAVILSVLFIIENVGDNRPYRDYDSTTVRAASTQEPPVYIIVFDELPYTALLGPDGRIDSKRFPNFAKLASESLTLENATSNFFYTGRSVPQLIDSIMALTERYNLHLYSQAQFVERRYADACGERLTCRGAYHLAETLDLQLAGRLGLRSVFEFLPRTLQREAGTSLAWLMKGVDTASPAADPEGWHLFTLDLLNEFLADVNDAPGNIYFLHLYLPHFPFIFDHQGPLATGSHRDFRAGSPGSSVTSSPEWERYLQQIEYTDRVLGYLVERLITEQLYGSSTLIVTSDHGLRGSFPENQGEVFQVDDLMPSVIMFIHDPEVAPGLSAIDYQHIDFGPTIFDLLEATPSEMVEQLDIPLPRGVSALEPERPLRSKKFFLTYSGEGVYRQYIYRAEDRAWILKETQGDSLGRSDSLPD